MTPKINKTLAEYELLDLLETPSKLWSVLSYFRNHKKILIEVTAIDAWDSWIFTILGKDCLSPIATLYISEDFYKTYEEAVEAGILYYLENLYYD